MTENGGMAFARLFSQRRAEIDLSVVDIAVRTGRPIEVVVGWDQGRAVPDGEELSKVAEILQLPKPLLKEAMRRVADHRLATPLPDSPASGSPDAEDSPQEPAPMSPQALIATPYPSASFTDRLRQLPDVALRAVIGTFADMRQSLIRKRRMARAPTAYPSYMEDRNQLITYRLRMVFTAAGVAVLALILRWSLGGLGSAISDLWNALTGAL